MKTMHRWRAAACGLAIAAAAAVAAPSRVPLAVLGDSNSQAHEGNQAGGAAVWQWTQVLAHWRGNRLDMGAWGSWGESWPPLVRAAEWLAQPLRTPRKQDYAYNFAISAQGCESLLAAPVRQALHLRDLIKADPKRWAEGVVVVQVGAMDFSSPAWLEAASRNPDDPDVTGRVRLCQQALTRTVALLERAQPELRLVLVGAFNEANDPAMWARWHNPRALARIDRVLDGFDEHLRQLAALAPERRVFVDQRAWFTRHWGGRDPETGQPAYRTLTEGGLQFAPGKADAADRGPQPDLHFGTAANALWAQELAATLHRQWPQLGIEPIADSEVSALWLSLQTVASAPAGH